MSQRGQSRHFCPARVRYAYVPRAAVTTDIRFVAKVPADAVSIRSKAYAALAQITPIAGTCAKTSAAALSDRFDYCVSTATLVSPRMVLGESVNVTKTRLLAGSNGTLPLADTKT
jgi:hypothetical protein